jgi:phosphoglycolate phosphatase
MRPLFVFDFDGVLAASLEPFERAVRAACARAGYPRLLATRADFLALFDLNFYAGLTAAGLPEERRGEFMALLQQELLRGAAEVRCFPGVAQMLAQLAGHATICLVTSNLAAVVQGILERHGIGAIAEVAGAEQGAGKVARIRAMCERHPHDIAFYVGDTAGDMIEGREAGARTVAVTWGWHDRQRLLARHPDHIVDRPEALLAIATRPTPD